MRKHQIHSTCILLAIACLLSAIGGCDSSSGTVTAVNVVSTPSSVTGTQTTAQGQANVADPKVAAAAAIAEQNAAKLQLRNITFDTIKFEMEKGEKFDRKMLTPEIEKLDGQRVKLRGYMLPSTIQSGIEHFILVRDNLECCFGPGAALFDSTVVLMADGETTELSLSPIAVEGTFRIHEVSNPYFGRPEIPGRPKENSHMSIFRLEDAVVR